MEQLSRFAQWIGGDDDAQAGQEPGDAFLLQDDPDARDNQVQQLLQQYSVLLEYERLKDLLPPGMYIMPSLDSILSWHGTIFIRQGFYRGAVFKFQLDLPEDYPDSPPELRFTSDVFHPMVDPSTGRVDISAIFPEWRPGRDYASFVLPHLHRALLRREYFSSSARHPLNAEARDLFLQEPSRFSERVARCAQQSLEDVYQNSKGFALKFVEGPGEAHDELLAALQANKHGAVEDRKDMFVDWFCTRYGGSPAEADGSSASAAQPLPGALQGGEP